MIRRSNRERGFVQAFLLVLVLVVMAACSKDSSTGSSTRQVPHEGQWGIYALNLTSSDVTLLYSSNDAIFGLSLSNDGGRIALALQAQPGAVIDTTSEIYILDLATSSTKRLTTNNYFDSYPSFSPDDSSIVFLSDRDSTLDLYVMNSDGGNQRLLYNSGGHDADVNWGPADRIVFTRDHQIWSVDSTGSNPQQLTDPPNAGFTGSADLPIGDYDPRFSPDGSTVAFERLVNVTYVHGGYDIYVVPASGGTATALTSTGEQGYSQGFPNWSHAGDRLVYILGAVNTAGKYDIYMMNADGSANHSVTPAYFPPLFLCHNAVFSLDDSKIYFIGQWYQ